MAHGRDFRRAIDRLVSDLTRIAELAIAQEVERAIDLAVRPIEFHTRGSSNSTRGSTRGARARSVGNGPERKSRAERALERHAKREAERQRREAEREVRDAERLRRKAEREQMRQELQAARDMARQARIGERARAKQQEKTGFLEQREKARVEKLAPPPLVVFKRSRDGQLTALKPRPMEAPEAPPVSPPSAVTPSQ